MRAITVTPLQAGTAAIEDLPEPPETDGPVLVETLAVGVCGTDIEIVGGDYGWAPPGHQRLVLGHESIGRVLEAPEGAPVAKGDHVVAFVRRPDPEPCYSCAVGEWDACKNGRYTEHGIKELDGFLRERYRAQPDALVAVHPALEKLGVLLEPTTIVAKAWAQVEAIGNRSTWHPKTVLVTGAGPVGLLAALLAVQRGLEVHVIDQVTSGIKPELVASLGATYHSGSIADALKAPDVIIECTGVPPLVFQAMDAVGIGGVVCLTGVSSTGHQLELDGGGLNRDLVLTNKSVVGSVNANRAHYEAGAKALEDADAAWLARLITRHVPFEQFHTALAHGPEDVKVVIDVGD